MKTQLLWAMLTASLVASLMVWIGLDHNAMGEFCVDPGIKPCNIDYYYVAGVWFSWFIVLLCLLLLMCYAVKGVSGWLKTLH